MEKVIVCRNKSEFSYWCNFLYDYCVEFTSYGTTITAEIRPGDYDEVTGEWFPYHHEDRAQQ